MREVKLPSGLFLKIPKLDTVKDELVYLREELAKANTKIDEQGHILMSYENDAYEVDKRARSNISKAIELLKELLDDNQTND